MSAIVFVPFSVSHAQTDFSANIVIAESAHDHRDGKKHHDIHISKDCEWCGNDYHHENHEGPNCCSSICGGALTIVPVAVETFKRTTCKLFVRQQSLEPGESVPPFRPPSI